MEGYNKIFKAKEPIKLLKSMPLWGKFICSYIYLRKPSFAGMEFFLWDGSDIHRFLTATCTDVNLQISGVPLNQLEKFQCSWDLPRVKYNCAVDLLILTEISWLFLLPIMDHHCRLPRKRENSLNFLRADFSYVFISPTTFHPVRDCASMTKVQNKVLSI